MSLPSYYKKIKGDTPQWAREVIAEFMGTLILMVFGIGAGAQKTLSRGELGSYLSINISSGMAVTFAVYWALSISGGHVNPAVTLAFASVQRFPWRKVPMYIAAQMTAGFVGSAFVYGLYSDAMDAFDGGQRQILGNNGTAGIFASYPHDSVSNMTGFWDQFFGTAMLLALIFALVDEKNDNRPGKGTVALIIGLIVFLIGMTFGYNCGYPINPARDLAPRIFTAMAGWGGDVFTVHKHWGWIPPIACSLGGIAGGHLYILTVEIHRQEPTIVENPETQKTDLEGGRMQNHVSGHDEE